jgi:hypothetical protein
MPFGLDLPVGAVHGAGVDCPLHPGIRPEKVPSSNLSYSAALIIIWTTV